MIDDLGSGSPLGVGSIGACILAVCNSNTICYANYVSQQVRGRDYVG